MPPGGGALGDGAGEFRRRRVLAAGEHEVGGGAGEQALQHAPPLGKVGQAAADVVAEAGGQGREAAEGGGDRGLDAGAQQPRQHRRSAAGGDRDGQRVAVDHGGHDAAAQVRPIDDVARDAGRPRRLGQRAQLGLGRVGADGDGAAGEQIGREPLGLTDLGAGASQQLGLARCDLAGAEQQGGTAAQVEEDRKMLHGCGSGGVARR